MFFGFDRHQTGVQLHFGGYDSVTNVNLNLIDKNESQSLAFAA